MSDGSHFPERVALWKWATGLCHLRAGVRKNTEAYTRTISEFPRAEQVKACESIKLVAACMMARGACGTVAIVPKPSDGLTTQNRVVK